MTECSSRNGTRREVVGARKVWGATGRLGTLMTISESSSESVAGTGHSGKAVLVGGCRPDGFERTDGFESTSCCDSADSDVADAVGGFGCNLGSFGQAVEKVGAAVTAVIQRLGNCTC